MELRTIFDLIVKMSALKDSFYAISISEFEARKEYKTKISAENITKVSLLIFMILINHIYYIFFLFRKI
jgi:hypothetical protein